MGVHVVIVGAGEVGGFLAERLLAEDHDVAVVEKDPTRAAEIGALLDVQVVVGSGSSPEAMADAGLAKAQLMASVTENDEVNLIASLLAAQHDVERTVIRIQNPELRGDAGAELRQRVGADLVIDPDADTADEILELVHATGTDEVYSMAGGEIMLIGAVVREAAPLVGRSLADIGRSEELSGDFLFGALTRAGRTVIPRGEQELRAGDHVRVLCTKQGRRRILDLLGVAGGQATRVMVLGGGAIGGRLAQSLQDEGADVVLVERDPERASELAERLHKVVVVAGEVTDTELLAEESVGRMDAVVAATGQDAANVLACAFAAAEGALFTVAVLHRLALLPLVAGFGIDAALSPRTASANAVLRYVRGGISAVATFLESDAEVDEIEIQPGSAADGVEVADLHLPHEMLIGAVIRHDGSAEIARGNTVLAAPDHVVVFARPQALASARGYFLK